MSAGYLLAGGGSLRFGSDKALAEFDGRPLLLWTFDLLAAVCAPVQLVVREEKYAKFGLHTLADRWPGEGPLGGILTALLDANAGGGSEWSLMIGCDMPFLTRSWLEHLLRVAEAHPSAQVVVPSVKGRLEPLCACWRRSAAPQIQAFFDSGVRRVSETIRNLQAEVLDESHWKRFDTAGNLFWNMNSPADYKEALRVWEARTS